MEQLNLTVKLSSKSRVIASSGPFQIELMKQVGLEDHPQLIEISHHLAGEYGEAAVLTKETINKYFNKQGSLPFIARYRGDIIGYIIGVPLEELDTKPWARMDENFSKNNTLYTYAFVIMNKYKGNGYAKILKRVYLSWAKKRDDIRYITGHVKESISAKFTGDIKIISRVENWQETGKTFEYYQRDLGPKPENKYKNNPPLVENV